MSSTEQPTSLMGALEALVKEQSKEGYRNGPVVDDEEGFVMLAKESIWTKLFGQYFMGIGDDQDELVANGKEHIEDDDMLFYVCSKPGEKGQEVAVYRKSAVNLPGLGDPHINWEESVYLNLILHDLQYTLTCAVCCRLPTQDLKVLRKQTLNVHASPHMRRMDKKDETSDQSYPNIFFMIDSFDEVFRGLCVQEDEICCVELVAKWKGTSPNTVIFLGSVKYDSLIKVYESKESLGSKMAQRMSLSWMTGGSDHVEFIRMRGPHGKGYAEMAVSHYKDEFIENNVAKTEIRNTSSAVNRRKGPPIESSSCKCPVDTTQSNLIYAPTTTDDCQRCSSTSEYDDGNPKFWSNTVKWFQQKKKSGSQVLSTHLTYVTLPWSRIMKDILQVRQRPVFLKDGNRRDRNSSSSSSQTSKK